MTPKAQMGYEQADQANGHGPPRSRVRPPLPLALIGLLAAASLLAAPAGAETRYRLSGAGYGHGVGMSQWGAYGYARHGSGYREIATHYYRGTKLGKLRAGRTIEVLVATRSGSVSFGRTKRACGHDLRPSSTYRAELRGSRVRLERSDGARIAGCGRRMVAKGVAGPLRIGGAGSYRGDLVVTASGGTLYVVNRVSLDDYVKGVVPNEMPSAWPLAALEAQAVAARSYALATSAGSGVFDQYDDTRSQVYGGLRTETARTNRAVRKSRRRVLLHHGEVITAFFFSSSGGRTENVELGFPGASPSPYLKSVKDPYDGASPDHRWRETFTKAEMAAGLSGLFRGRFKGIRVIRRGVSPRIVRASVLGSRGSSIVTGTDLRSRLALRSTWVKFKRLR